MFLLCVSVHRGGPPVQSGGPPVQSGEPPVQSGGTPVQSGPLVKVQVKVWGPPRSRSRSRSGGPPVKVQVKVWGPPVKVQVKVWGSRSKKARAWVVCLLRSHRRTVLCKIIYFCLSGVDSRLRICPPEDATLLPETKLLPRLREMKLRNTAQSEGYETMTQHSSDMTTEVK